jgi:hypothetical protein
LEPFIKEKEENDIMAGQVQTDTPQQGVQMNVGVSNSSEWLVGGPAQTRMAYGTIALDGSNPTSVTTGLNSISCATANLNQSTAPGDATSTLTCTWSGGTLNIYAWMPVSGTDPTLAASTNTETVSWIAVGVS